MPALDDFCREKLAALEKKHRRRQPATLRRLPGGYIEKNGKKLLSFSCNDYLGLSTDAAVQARVQALLAEYGEAGGSGASRLVTGNHPLYDALEAKLAALKGTEAACVFGSGYLANLSIIPALLGKGDLILADRLVHACMIDGAKLADARLLRFAHNDSDSLRQLLQQHRADHRHCLILTESVFSMDGDRAPLAALQALAEEYDSWLYVDDAHGLGVSAHSRNRASATLSAMASSLSPSPCRGRAGEGVDSIPLHMGTLSKAVGAYGGYLCASQPVIDYMKSTARGLIFTTALPPVVLAQALAGLEVIEQDTERVARPLALARRFTDALHLPEAQSAIVPMIIGEEATALAMSAALEEAGFLVSAIRPPTVPPGTARLRFTFSAAHREENVDRLVEAVQELSKK